MKDCIKGYESLEEIRKKHKTDSIVLVGGCFDILHYGHFYFLKKAKEAGDILVVILESDKHIKTYKKRNSVHDQEKRAEILCGFEFVDYVISIPFLDKDEQYLDLIKKISPEKIAVTANDPRLKEKKMHAEAIGARIIEVAPKIKGYSSTTIINKFK